LRLSPRFPLWYGFSVGAASLWRTIAVVGLEEIDDDIWSPYFCHVLLTRIDERDDVLRA
jgi:hypothetical protein